MATVAFLLADANTAASPRTTGSFTPTAGSLIVAFVYGSATVTTVGTFTTSTSITFVKAGTSAASGGSAEALHCFVAQQFSTATSMTATFDSVGDQTTGQVIFIFEVNGMSLTGASAVRQTAKQDNQAGPAAPAPAFASSALTGNPTLGCVGVEGASGGPALTPPTNWTEPAGGDTGYTVPNTGAECCFRNSGFTGTTITWNTSTSIFCSFIVELDASGSIAIQPTKAFNLAVMRSATR